MKVTIDFGEELQPPLQFHLENGGSVQSYIRASVAFFNELYKYEKSGDIIGFGDPDTEVSPAKYLSTFP